MMKKLLTTAEVAQVFQVHPKTVKKWIKHGEIQAFQIVKGGQWRIPTDKLPEWMQDYLDLGRLEEEE